MNKHIFALLLWLIPTVFFAQNANSKFTYTIHVGAFVKASPEDFRNIDLLGPIYQERFDESVKRVYLGHYETENAAHLVLDKVRQNGFPDAYVTRRPLDENEQVTVVQLAIRPVNKSVNWSEFSGLGTLGIIQKGTQMKMISGPYLNMNEAKQALKQIKTAGFTDAFIKVALAGQIIPVGTFESHGQLEESYALNTQKDEAVQSYDAVVAPEGDLSSKGGEPDKIILTETTDIPQDLPQSYDDSSTPKGPLWSKRVISFKRKVALEEPKISVEVKRNSAYELQKILKAKGTYSGSLDGYYGKETLKGYTSLLKADPQLMKYEILRPLTEDVKLEDADNPLQHTLNGIPQDPQSGYESLQGEGHPLALAYQAYLMMAMEGSSSTVDELMNKANQSAFADKPLKNKAPFDYDATYAYKEMDQLVEHLSYIHSMFEENYQVPCWLYRQHPSILPDLMGKKGLSPELSGCAAKIDWPAINLLSTIAADLNPTGKVNPREYQQLLAERALLLLSPASVTPDAKAEDWHKRFIKGMDSWANEEPLHRKLCSPLMVSYFQSMVLMEEFFMSHGHKPLVARKLAIDVLKTYIEPHLAAYLAPAG